MLFFGILLFLALLHSNGYIFPFLLCFSLLFFKRGLLYFLREHLLQGPVGLVQVVIASLHVHVSVQLLQVVQGGQLQAGTGGSQVSLPDVVLSLQDHFQQGDAVHSLHRPAQWSHADFLRFPCSMNSSERHTSSTRFLYQLIFL